MDITAKIGLELGDQYTVSYVSANQARDGKYRKIAVKTCAVARPACVLAGRLFRADTVTVKS